MPQMTGIELAEEIGRDLPALPVILATGYGELSPTARRKIFKLAKPFDEQDLLCTIALALRGRHQPPSGAP